MPETLLIGFSSALIMGLAFGAGPCNITCLPYLGPVFLGQNNQGFKGSWKTILPFSLGRLTGYTLLGAVAGGLGLSVTKLIEEGIALQLLGLATILAGLFLLFSGKLNKNKACQSRHSNAAVEEQKPVLFKNKPEPARKKSGFYLSISLFSMGTGMALNPCLPLLTILSVAATMADPADGAKLGIAFGLGAVVIPTLFFGLAIAWFSQQIKFNLNEWRKPLEMASAYMLILLGASTMFGWVQP